MIDVFSMLLHSHNTIKKAEIILSKYKILNQNKIVKIIILYLKKEFSQFALIELHFDAGVEKSQFECNECVEQMHLKTVLFSFYFPMIYQL